MTIHVKATRMDSESDPDDPVLNKIIKLAITVEGSNSIELFTKLIDRGLGCWEDAPAALKELGDKITHGRITQNHVKQPINTQPESNPELGTGVELARVQAFVETYGIQMWKEMILSGESHLVIAGTWRPKPALNLNEQTEQKNA